MQNFNTSQYVVATFLAMGLTGGFLGGFYGYIRAVQLQTDRSVIAWGMTGAIVGLAFPISIPWFVYRQLTRKA